MSLPFFKKRNAPVAKNEYEQAVSSLRDLIAPSGLVINSTSIKLGETFCRTLFILTYPRYLSMNWFTPIIEMEQLFNISISYHPVDNALILRQLRKKLGDVGAQVSLEQERGAPRNPILETSLNDIENLRDAIVQGREKMFRVALYITLMAKSENELNQIEAKVQSLLESKLIYIKSANFRQFEGYESSLPLNLDRLGFSVLLNSGPASTLFPFISLDLTDNKGVLYGVNVHNNSLVIFDRFSMENANMCVFGTAGSGKSYAVKIEALRSLILDTTVLIIDPENEYQYLSQSIGGSFFKISVGSENHINPFDLPIVGEGETAAEVFRSHVLTLIGLIKILVGGLTPKEEVVVDQAITQTYAARDISAESNIIGNMPILEDLRAILDMMEGGSDVAAKLYKYTKGTYAGFLNQQTNVSINERFVIFNIRDLEEELRPIAMYIVLNYIWNSVKKEMKKRLLIVDEAWYLLKHQESADFLFGIAKRSRKYYLGLTTITQDIGDFLDSPYGVPIITNSALKLLFKQSSATIDKVANALHLTEVEKAILLQAEVGTGLFIAGNKHAVIQVVPSYTEDQMITSDPQQLLAMKKNKE